MNLYLNFNGNAEEAFDFYKSVFGGDFTTAVRFGDAPSGTEMGKLSADDREKIMHIELPIGNGNVLMGTDALESMGQNLTTGNNFSIYIAADSREDTERIFNALAAGGKVTMPLAKTFWSEYFGTCNDKFGIAWKVNYENK